MDNLFLFCYTWFKFILSMKKIDLSFIIQELRKVDLTERESRAYITLLRHGTHSVQQLSHSMRLTRPTMYRIVDSLESKGLIYKTTLKGKKIGVFAAKSPDEIISLLRRKRRQAEEQERELLRIISELRKGYYGETHTIDTYPISEEGLRTVLDDIMTANVNEIYIWHTNKSEDTPLTLDTLAMIYDTLRTRRGTLNIHEVTSNTHANEIVVPFGGSLIIADKVYMFSSGDITIIDKASLRNLLISLVILSEYKKN